MATIDDTYLAKLEEFKKQILDRNDIPDVKKEFRDFIQEHGYINVRDKYALPMDRNKVLKELDRLISEYKVLTFQDIVSYGSNDIDPETDKVIVLPVDQRNMWLNNLSAQDQAKLPTKNYEFWKKEIERNFQGQLTIEMYNELEQQYGSFDQYYSLLFNSKENFTIQGLCSAYVSKRGFLSIWETTNKGKRGSPLKIRGKFQGISPKTIKTKTINGSPTDVYKFFLFRDKICVVIQIYYKKLLNKYFIHRVSKMSQVPILITKLRQIAKTIYWTTPFPNETNPYRDFYASLTHKKPTYNRGGGMAINYQGMTELYRDEELLDDEINEHDTKMEYGETLLYEKSQVRKVTLNIQPTPAILNNTCSIVPYYCYVNETGEIIGAKDIHAFLAQNIKRIKVLDSRFVSVSVFDDDYGVCLMDGKAVWWKGGFEGMNNKSYNVTLPPSGKAFHTILATKYEIQALLSDGSITSWK